MPRNLKTVVAAAALLGGLLAAPALYAHGTGGSGMMGGMMQGRQGDMMGQGGMMEHCNEMTQGMDDHGVERPNERWQERSPQQQDQLQPEHNGG